MKELRDTKPRDWWREIKNSVEIIKVEKVISNLS